MSTDCIAFKKTGYFSDLICDYLAEDEVLKPFYNRFPTPENFKGQIEEKKQYFPKENRDILVKALTNQYKDIQASVLTSENIESLKSENTFTIVTGHQLNLFTGPLYFLYKITSTINLAEQLKEKYPGLNFVPVYWMATEDHDFDEINYFNLHGKKFQWNRNVSGAVGELSTEGLSEVFNLLDLEVGSGIHADKVRELFKKAYLEYNNLTDATRYLANELFAEYGLVILDGHDKELKKLFVPHLLEELKNHTSNKSVLETVQQLNNLTGKNYNIQVNPREINLFYLAEGLRERIVDLDGSYFVNETDIKWSKEEIIKEVNEHPERFSPNVIMRPLYQEVILPNLCYIGGAGELAYWFELKSYFEAAQIPFPVLLLRNSVLLITEKQAAKLKNLNITYPQLFMKRHAFINKKVREISDIDIDFSSQKKHLQKQFEDLYDLAMQTDKSFLGAVKAQEVKQLKGLDKLEKRLLKAQKRKLADEVSRMADIQNELFPNGSLQERSSNFSEFYLQYGPELIKRLKNDLKPLEQELLILSL